jgi:uncharacterized phiE125 gp8 family phage protein
MSLIVKTPATFLPLSLDEAKVHLRIEVDTIEDDSYITSLLNAATEHVEESTNFALARKTYQLFLDAFPGQDPRTGEAVIALLPVPIISVDSIAYIDADGAAQVLVAADYQVDLNSEPGRIVPAYGETWPSTRQQPNAVTVEFRAGYCPAGCIAALAINAAGTTYSADDVLTVVRAGATGGTAEVTEIGEGGAVTEIEFLTGGSDYSVATALVTTVLPSGGTGCKVNVTALDAQTVPDRFKVALRWLVAHWYEERQIVTDRARIPVPAGYDRLIWSLRLTRFA